MHAPLSAPQKQQPAATAACGKSQPRRAPLAYRVGGVVARRQQHQQPRLLHAVPHLGEAQQRGLADLAQHACGEGRWGRGRAWLPPACRRSWPSCQGRTQASSTLPHPPASSPGFSGLSAPASHSTAARAAEERVSRGSAEHQQAGRSGNPRCRAAASGPLTAAGHLGARPGQPAHSRVDRSGSKVRQAGGLAEPAAGRRGRDIAARGEQRQWREGPSAGLSFNSLSRAWRAPLLQARRDDNRLGGGLCGPQALGPLGNRAGSEGG